ncbi:Hemicentin-2 [Anabarilius grahami]|uniref:Hemicentin-2 n=1 Tax=Anabarilius grahami TaxID=495550 RepID=A0A3N0YA07_ANAGA|nr:Hemicentin-2 [Anabarilius grahami]
MMFLCRMSFRLLSVLLMLFVTEALGTEGENEVLKHSDTQDATEQNEVTFTTGNLSDTSHKPLLPDIDECNFEESCRRELGNVCVNTEGSYTCVCQAGFREDRAACVDVDECVEEQRVCVGRGECENTLGSYRCVCQRGYRGNGTHCTDINECLTGDHGCDVNARCGNVIGSYFCQCHQGYSGDGHSCYGQCYGSMETDDDGDAE